MNKMAIGLLLLAIAVCGCADYTTRRAVVAEGPRGGTGPEVSYNIVNTDSTSNLVFNNYSDFSRVISAHGGWNVIVIWNCNTYKDKPNRYVRATFGFSQYGWYLDAIYDSEGKCK